VTPRQPLGSLVFQDQIGREFGNIDQKQRSAIWKFVKAGRNMLDYADEPVERESLKARPQPDLDRKELRSIISKRYSVSLAYLGR